MKKQDIIAAITAKTGRNYAIWRIGLTHDEAERKKQWTDKGHSTNCWTSWIADSLSDAQDIETHFINLGMKGGTGGDLSPHKSVAVYVF